MTLDAYLDWKKIGPVAFGRSLRSLRRPEHAREYLRRLKSGQPNKRYRRPKWPMLLEIYHVTNKAVTPNDFL